MCYHRQGDQDGFGKRGLVDLASHEEIGLGTGDRSGDGGDEGDVGEMERGEDTHCVARELLNPHDWRRVSNGLSLQSTERVNQRTHDRRWDQDL